MSTYRLLRIDPATETEVAVESFDTYYMARQEEDRMRKLEPEFYWKIRLFKA